MTRSIPVGRARWMTSLAAAALLSVALLVALVAKPAVLGGATVSPQPTTSHQPTTAGSSSALDPRIAALVGRHPEQPIETIVQFRSGVSAERARWDVSRFAGHVVADLHIINALAARLPAERARWLARSRDVRGVSLNATVKTESGPLGPEGPIHRHHHHHHGRTSPADLLGLATTYNQTLNADALWRLGIDGRGVGVAVIDTGVDGSLPDFQGAAGGGSRVLETAVTNPQATNAADGYGHGTDVAGIIAGDGRNLPPSNPLHGQYVGVAPNANLISIKASDDQGNATVLDVIYGLQFAIDHQSDYNIRVVNLSLDSQTPQSYKVDPLDAAAEAAWMHGIVVVAAAGNRGKSDDAVQYAPANDPYVITVGAVDENGQANPANDTAASWSSRGTTQDGFQKPDVYAPGAHIVSVLAPTSAFAGMCTPCQVGGEYIQTSGTSMATPMISGLAADLLQAHPGWTPDELKGALMSRQVASNPLLQEINAAEAVALFSPPRANAGLTPNRLVDPASGNIDYSRSSWSRSSWSAATGSLSASFARSSWSCTCSGSGAGSGNSNSSGKVDSSRSSWSRSSWSTNFDPTSAEG